MKSHSDTFFRIAFQTQIARNSMIWHCDDKQMFPDRPKDDDGKIGGSGLQPCYEHMKILNVLFFPFPLISPDTVF